VVGECFVHAQTFMQIQLTEIDIYQNLWLQVHHVLWLMHKFSIKWT